MIFQLHSNWSLASLGWLQLLQVHTGLGGLVHLLSAGEAHHGVPVPLQPCHVGLHGSSGWTCHASLLQGPLVQGWLVEFLVRVLLEIRILFW